MAPPPVRAAAHPALAAALALVVVLLGAAAPASAQSNNPKANSAIVIGAGMAGLAAADALCAKGFSVTVLEGRQRIGGRTYTAKLAGSGAPVEVGAGWLHDADPARNVLADFAIENGLPTLVDDDEELAWLIGGPPPAVGKQDPAKTAAWQAKAEEFGDLAAAAEDNWPASKPLLNYFNAWVAAERLAGDELAGVKAILQSDVGDLEYGAPMSKINAQWSGEGEQGDGEERLLAGEGYSGITALLERRIRARPACANAFSLGAKVTQITVTPSPAARRGVHVRVGNGTVLSAKFAVTTLPLGVLKAGGVNFNPNLTAAKRAAMDRLSMGLLNKVALVYEDAWWEEDGAGGAESPGASSWFVPAYPKAPAEGNAFEFWNHNRFFKGSNAVVMLLGACILVVVLGSATSSRGLFILQVVVDARGTRRMRSPRARALYPSAPLPPPPPPGPPTGHPPLAEGRPPARSSPPLLNPPPPAPPEKNNPKNRKTQTTKAATPRSSGRRSATARRPSSRTSSWRTRQTRSSARCFPLRRPC